MNVRDNIRRLGVNRNLVSMELSDDELLSLQRKLKEVVEAQRQEMKDGRVVIGDVLRGD